MALIARGFTNKEMAARLGITERGVSARISRLLARYDVPNRAGLVARALAGRELRETLAPTLRRQLAAYHDSPFAIGYTVGPDNEIAYRNEASRRMMGIGPEDRRDEKFATRRASPGTARWREAAAIALRTGIPATLPMTPTRWLDDDGAWKDGMVTCVIQPVGERGNVHGLLWICATALPLPAG